MIKLIENAEPIVKKINASAHPEIKIQYLNQLMDIGFYAVNIGYYERDSNEVIEAIKNKNTKIIVTINTKENFEKAINNSKIDFIEISIDLFEKFELNSLDSSKIILNYSIYSKKEDKLEIINTNLYLKKINLQSLNLSASTTKFLQNFENKITDNELAISIYSIGQSYNEIFNYLYNSKFKFIEISFHGWLDSKNKNLIPTQKMITYLMKKNEKININTLALETAYNTAKKIFSEF